MGERAVAEMGRPTRLTPELAKLIEDRVRLTGHINPAAEQVGVPGPMACEWVARGEGRHPSRRKLKVYAEFAEMIRKAQADNVLRRLGRIEQAAKGGAVLAKRTVTQPTRQLGPDGTPLVKTVTEERYAEPQWTADAWFLERFDPELWGRRIVEHTGPEGRPLGSGVNVLFYIPGNEREGNGKVIEIEAQGGGVLALPENARGDGDGGEG